MLKSAIRSVIPAFGYSFPSANEVIEEFEKTKFTPDISRLTEKEWHPVFVCDELKKDHLKHNLLGMDAKFAYPAYTQGLFQLWEPRDDATLSSVPIKHYDPYALDIRFFPKAAKIKGEVYYIRSLQFLVLDNYKQNTVEFRRQKSMVIVPYRPVKWLKDPYLDPDNTRSGYHSPIKVGEERIHLARVWMYVGRKAYWEPLLNAFSFKPAETFTSEKRNWCKTYYSIRKPKAQKK